MAHRGRRLDETKPGSGLGLSIVVDLAQLYRGSVVLELRRSAACGPNWFCPAPDPESGYRFSDKAMRKQSLTAMPACAAGVLP